jgi:hypothetical protein
MNDLTRQNAIQEKVDTLRSWPEDFECENVLDLIEKFEDEAINLSSKLSGSTLARATYCIGWVVGFADAEEKTVAELFDEESIVP